LQDTADGYWTAALTRPNAERRAAAALERRGMNCFLPFTTSPFGRSVLLLPGYLFVYVLRPLLEEHWHAIVTTFGVRRLLVCGDRPACLAGEWIEALRAGEREAAAGTEASIVSFLPGSAVRITAGPFAGCSGVFVGIASARARSPPETRALVEVTVFRRATLIEVAAAALQEV
jgi:transcription antitermination factor NusG